MKQLTMRMSSIMDMTSEEEREMARLLDYEQDSYEEDKKLYQTPPFRITVGIGLLMGAIQFQQTLGMVISFVMSVAGAILVSRDGLEWKKEKASANAHPEVSYINDELELLNDAYYTMHDLRTGAFEERIDHVVIGPNGIFVIVAKSYSGYSSNLGVIGREALKQASSLRGYLSKRLRNNSSCLIDVIPIVVLLNRQIPTEAKGARLIVTSEEDLCYRIMSYQKDVWFSEEQVSEIAMSLM